MALKTIVVCDNCGDPTPKINCIDHTAYCDKPECQEAKKTRASLWEKGYRYIPELHKRGISF